MEDKKSENENQEKIVDEDMEEAEAPEVDEEAPAANSIKTTA